MQEVFLAVCCQCDFEIIDKREDIKKRADKMLSMIDNVVNGYNDYLPVKLITFPEFSLTPITTNNSSDLLKNIAIPENNDYIDKFIDKAREYNLFINIGSFIEKTEKWPKAVFNTSLVVGPNGVILRYRKANPFLPFEPVYSPHDLKDYDEEIFPVAQTEIGNIGVEICYDNRFPEVTRKLSLKGAEIIIIPSAYMEPWGGVTPTDVWKVINRARAIENSVYVIACSLGSSYRNHPPYSWVGNSMIIDFEGRIIAQSPAGPSEQILVAPIYMKSLRAYRAATNMFSLLHLRTEIYKDVYSKPIFPSELKNREYIDQKILREKTEKLKRKYFYSFYPEKNRKLSVKKNREGGEKNEKI